MITQKINTTRNNRAHRVRSRLLERSTLPRLIVRRSNSHMHAQIVATDGTVLSNFSTLKLKDFKGTKTEAATKVGEELAALAKKQKVEAVVLDRGHYRFHG